MSKTFKRLAAVAVVVVGAVLLLWIAAFLYVDSLAATAVRRGATDALGVDTDVGSVDIGLAGGEAVIQDVVVANPPGFESPFFLRLERASAQVSLGSLFAETIRLGELRFSGLRSHLDQVGTASNYGAILDHLETREADRPEQPAEGKKFVIDELVIEDARVVVRAKLLPTSAEWTEVVVPVDLIELREIGTGEEGGMPIDQLAGVIVKVVLSTVLENAGDQLPDGVGAALRAGLAPLKSLEDLGVQAAARAAAAAQKTLQDAAREALEGVLGGKNAQQPPEPPPKPQGAPQTKPPKVQPPKNGSGQGGSAPR